MQQRTVLVVDDEAPMVAFISDVLRMAGFDVVAQTSSHTVVKRVDAGDRYDLAVLDVVMPELSGEALAAHLRRHQPDLPVLYVTGFDEALFQARPMLWAGESFLEKPFSPEGLLEAVSLALDGRISVK
jgi:CheY-like chemotaxis protein